MQQQLVPRNTLNRRNQQRNQLRLNLRTTLGIRNEPFHGRILLHQVLQRAKRVPIVERINRIKLEERPQIHKSPHHVVQIVVQLLQQLLAQIVDGLELAKDLSVLPFKNQPV